MLPLRRDVARVEIDHARLYLQDVGRAGLTLFRDSTGDHTDRSAFAVCRCGEGCQLVARGPIGLNPDGLRLAIPALSQTTGPRSMNSRIVCSPISQHRKQRPERNTA